MRVWGIVLCGLLLAGCGSKKDASSAPAAEVKPVAIATAVAEGKTVPLSVQATGSFIADESSDVAPTVAGRITATPVDAGSFVKQGQVIARMDAADSEFKLAQ